MKHLKLTGPGYDKFNGHFGTIEFKDGVSVAPVNSVETLRLQSILNVQEIGDEVEEHAKAEKVTLDLKEKQAEAPAPAAAKAGAGEKHTRAELEAIADKGGIKAVREVAAAVGVSGKSINELIDGILGA